MLRYISSSANNTVGQTFLRGTQITDANGEVTFNTIYPGWFSGRTVHIHSKAHLSSNRVLTTQFVFPDDLTDTVFASEAPYNTRGARDTRNECDMVVEGRLLGFCLTPTFAGKSLSRETCQGKRCFV